MMTPLFVREMSDDECARIQRLTRAQAAPLRLVRRAKIIESSAERKTVPSIAKELGISERVVRDRIHRFNEQGLEGLDDAPRSGRPRRYNEDHRSKVIGKARSLPPKPEGAETPPTCHWTLDRLQEELNKEGLPIKRSQIRRILKAEHIKWQKPRSWLESDDPEFAQKRGPSSTSTWSRLKVALS